MKPRTKRKKASECAGGDIDALALFRERRLKPLEADDIPEDEFEDDDFDQALSEINQYIDDDL